MKKREILEKITELVDGEIKDPDEERMLLKIIYSNKEYIKEYQIQRNIKNLLRSRSGIANASDRLRQSIINRILG